MSKQILRDQSIYLGGYDLTGRSNALTLDYSAEMQDATTFGQSSHIRLGGLTMAAAQVAGFMDIDTTDAFQFSNIGVQDTPFSFGAKGDTVGDDAFTLLAAEGDIKIGAAVGDICAFDAGMQSTGKLIKGKILLNSKSAAITSTGAGTAQQLGAVASGKRIYIAAHVLNAGTGSATIKLQSDSTNAFSGAQTDRITLTAATSIGAQMSSVAGAITDTYWRVAYTISGASPSFKLVVIVGIL